MSIDLYFDILDDERRAVLPYLSHFKNTYYLAGGTGLALQIGHRDSVDFDFFQAGPFSTEDLAEKLRGIFSSARISVIQEEKDTLTVLIDAKVKVSFFSYPYVLVGPLIASEHLDLASIGDIGCMKLSAITGRSLLKDYVDLYFILQQVPLPKLLQSAANKYPNFNGALSLKSLAYFDDITHEPISYKHGNEVAFDTVKEFLQRQVKEALSD